MLKALFGLFEITESQLSKGAMLRLRVAGFLGLLALPLGIAKINQHSVINFIQFENWIDIAFVIAVVGFVVVGSTRAVNRLFIPDRYLDESEVARKRHVNATVFWIFMTVGILLMLVILAFMLSGTEMTLHLQSSHYMLVFLMGIFIPICCIQGLVLSFLSKPLDDDDSTTVMTAQDYKYLVSMIAFVTIATVLGIMIGR